MQTKEKINSEKSYSKKLELLRPALLNYTNKRVFNKQDAEDIVQNTLLILINKKDIFDPKKSFLSWGLNICQFQIKSYLTKRKRCLIDFFDDRNAPIECLGSFCCSTPARKLINKEKLSVFMQIKHLLTIKEKSIFELALSGHTPKEIKIKLKMTHGHYAISRHRGLAKAKKYFSNKSIIEYQP
jgi:RNA polymerase sigma factor (sigma-70 family)